MIRNRLAWTLAVSWLIAGCGATPSATLPAATPADAPQALVGEAGVPFGLLSQGGLRPPQARPFGQSFAELSADWWTQMLGLPYEDHPALATGELDLLAGQTGPIWHLAGTFAPNGPVVRTGEIRVGKPLFFPLINTAYLDSDPAAATRTVEEWRELVGTLDPTTMTLTVDDRTYTFEELDRYLFESPIFSLPVTEGSLINVLGIPAGDTVYGMATGYYVALPPLSAGEHTIHFVADNQDITYELTVTPPNR